MIFRHEFTLMRYRKVTGNRVGFKEKMKVEPDGVEPEGRVVARDDLFIIALFGPQLDLCCVILGFAKRHYAEFL